MTARYVCFAFALGHCDCTVNIQVYQAICPLHTSLAFLSFGPLDGPASPLFESDTPAITILRAQNLPPSDSALSIDSTTSHFLLLVRIAG